MSALGDLIYGGASGTGTRLAGNTTTTLKVLSQTGDGAASAAPSWLSAVSANTVSTLVYRDGSGNFAAGTITATLSGNASTATALASNPNDCSANQFANAIDAGGNLSCSALSDSDIPDTITASNYQPVDAALTAIAAGSDYVQFTGPTTSTKSFALPNANSTILTSNDLVTVAQGGTGSNTLTGVLLGSGTSAITGLNSTTIGQVLRVGTGPAIGWGAVDLADGDAVTGTLPVANLPAMVGDSGAGGTAGIVPAPGTGDAAAGKFLKADATWAVPPGGSPGGSSGQVQYNDGAGGFAGDSGLAYNDTTDSLGVIGSVVIGQTGTGSGALLLNGVTSGTVTIVPADAAGTPTLTLPTTTGTLALTSDIVGDDLGSAAAADVVTLFNSGTCSGYLKSDGTCDNPAGSGDVTAASSFGTDNYLITSDGTGKGVKAFGATGTASLGGVFAFDVTNKTIGTGTAATDAMWKFTTGATPTVAARKGNDSSTIHVIGGSFEAAASGSFYWGGRSQLQATADGYISFLNQAGAIGPIFNFSGMSTTRAWVMPDRAGTMALWRYHATDCTALTDGVEGELCSEQDSNTIYACAPTAGGCDTAGEWSQVSGSGGGYATIDDEDTPLTQRTTLNFEGAGVTCADDTDQTTCTISGGAGGTFPGSSTDNAVVRFDGTGGSTVQNSGVIVDDSDNVTIPGTLTVGSGITTGLDWVIGGAGDTGASDVEIYGGDGASNAEPGSVHLHQSATGYASWLFSCGAASGRFCGAAAQPAADSTDYLLSKSSTDTVSNKTLDNSNVLSGYSDIAEIAAPGTPAAGYGRVYFDSTAKELCTKDDAGAVVCASDGAGNTLIHTFGCTFDGGGSTITADSKCYSRIPVGGTITGWSIVAVGSSPTATIDVWKVASGTALPTNTETITAGAEPALATGNALKSTTLTGWTTSVTANDIAGFNVDAVANATWLEVKVYYTE
jgi:hypothetical protein